MENQEKVWDNIAPEWHEYKKIPSISSAEFIKKQSGNLLDLGSGSGRHLQKIEGKYYLQDISTQMLKLAEKKANELKIEHEIIHSSMDVIPFEDNFFDSAICISALHCVETKEQRENTVKELFRVLKKDSLCYIGVWNVNSKRFKRKLKNKGKEQMIGWTNKGDRYYYLFDEEEVHNLFKEIGFKIISTHNSEMMINFIAQK